MQFPSKCPKCDNNSFEYSFELTLREYVRENLQDIRTVLPYTEVPILPEYIVLQCVTESCGHAEKLSLTDYVARMRDYLADTARSISRRQLGTPDNYENYFKKYIYDKGLHKEISDSDRKNNPYLDRLIKYVEKKYSKDSTD